DAHGYPYEMPVRPGLQRFGGVLANANGHQYRISDNYYDLNFTFDPNDPGFDVNDPFADFPAASGINPKFPFNDWVRSGPDPNNAYIVAVRLSSAWASGKSLGVRVTNARMQPFTPNAAFD